MPFQKLYIVEHESGEMLDHTGDAGYSVWDTREEAQDALDCEEDAREDYNHWKIIEFARVGEAPPPAPRPDGNLVTGEWEPEIERDRRNPCP